MPPGSLETSFRSSAASAETEIFVVAAIWRSEIPRRSRASRSLPPKSVVTAVNLDTPIRACQRATQGGHGRSDVLGIGEEADRRDSRRAGRDGFRRAIFSDAADRKHGQLHTVAHSTEGIDTGNGMVRGFASRREDCTKQQVVAPSGMDGSLGLGRGVNGTADDERVRDDGPDV